MNAPSLIGHATQRTAQHRLLERDSLPHALLLTGPAGIGKSLIAKELALKILSLDHDLPRVEKLIAAGNHPDLLWVEVEEDGASTEDIRGLLHTLHLKSFAGQNRVIVLNDAHVLHQQAGNSLLKSLEEPRPGTYFILISSQSSQLLPTIVSRCQVWTFHELSATELKQVMEQIIEEDELSDEAKDLLSLISDGTLARVDQLKHELELWHSVKRGLVQISLGDKALALKLAKDLAKQKEKLPATFAVMRSYARNEMRANEDHETQSRWAEFLSQILSAEGLIQKRNLNATYQLQRALLELSP